MQQNQQQFNFWHVIYPKDPFYKNVDILYTSQNHTEAIQKLQEIKQEYSSCDCPYKRAKSLRLEVRGYETNQMLDK